MTRARLVLLVVAVAGASAYAGQRAEQLRAEAVQQRQADMLSRCAACFGCRAGYQTFCESLEREGFRPAVCNPLPELRQQ